MAQKTTTGPASTLRLPSDREIQIERSFDAPRELVWRAFTDAKLLPKWMGPAQYKMTKSEMDLRPGGKYRWVWNVDGSDLTIHGEFVQVDPPKKIVTKEFMEPNPTPTQNVMTFVEKAGRTTVSLVIQTPSKEIRDMMLATGMKDGMDLGYARLDGLLKGLA